MYIVTVRHVKMTLGLRFSSYITSNMYIERRVFMIFIPRTGFTAFS